jgi:DNA polymerase III subunit delta
MKLSTENLPRHLAKGLAPLYLIYGDAMLLAIEAADTIRLAARAAGYSEREVFIAERNFEWAMLRNSAQNMSLFSTKKVVDLRIPSGKPGLEGGQALQDYCQNINPQQINPDTLTLISLPRMDKAALNSIWFSTLAEAGVVIAAEEISLAALPVWIGARLKIQAQTTDPDTLAFLVQRVEGNLLAAYQEIQKLALIFPAGPLSFDQVKNSVMNVARYDVFKLSEAMLAGDLTRYTHILNGLRAEGTATVLILWTLAEDIRTLGKVLRAMKSAGNINAAISSVRVWKVKQQLIEHAVRRLSLARVERALMQAAHIDKVVKGLRPGDVWDDLLQLGVRFAQTTR